ncbi:type II secretion system F family protein [Nocardioides zeae]|uniref:Type II secretion system F family protein n=1 Tax=Nocardioides imazamoxiresistens TaxID=3231893 RepID=A0ABU3PZV6_9ACTN|nr:type II secretion system F family protein [Nocardioides zeae]MDT9594760.1 type II secretion system F family protein [Nocardioides zeae]
MNAPDVPGLLLGAGVPGLTAAALAALGAALLVAPPPRAVRVVGPRHALDDHLGASGAPARRRGGRGGALLAVVVAAVALVGGAGLVVLWVGLAVAVVLAGRSLLLRRRASAAAATRRTRVVAACDLLAAELRAGRPPGTALDAAAQDWEELQPVVRAEALGADVVGAWRDVARRPGAGGLRLVAAAWQVSERSGAGLAAVLARVAALTRATEATRRTVASELASARATARLMAGLPVVALLLGGTTGGDPVAFLLGTPVGLACLVGGLALGWLGLWWMERIADDVVGRA